MAEAQSVSHDGLLKWSFARDHLVATTSAPLQRPSPATTQGAFTGEARGTYIDTAEMDRRHHKGDVCNSFDIWIRTSLVMFIM